jgi:hypothetical protein
LAEATDQDTDLTIVKGWLLAKPEKLPWEQVMPMSSVVKSFWQQWDRLKISQGVIYRKWYDKRGLFQKWQIVLPIEYRRECVELAHTGRTGGHLGQERTAKQVQNRAYWVGWFKDVQSFVRTCHQCVTYHRGKAPRQGLLQAAPVGEPWERISIDITGPHPPSRNGNRYILTAMDMFSKWAEAWPIRNHEAVTVARILSDQLFARFGIPAQLLSVRGPEFEGQVERTMPCIRNR